LHLDNTSSKKNLKFIASGEQYRSLVLCGVRVETLKGEQMTFRSRLMFGLVIALMLFATAQNSLAQVSIGLTANPPSPGEIQTNKTAMTAEPAVTGGGILVTGSLIAASPLTVTRLRLTYPSPITSAPAVCYNSGSSAELACPDPNVPTADPIRVEGQTGVFATVTQPILNTAQSRIEIWLPLL
jgi:hypothetical protein